MRRKSKGVVGPPGGGREFGMEGTFGRKELTSDRTKQENTAGELAGC
jgi:hypothetical protein